MLMFHLLFHKCIDLFHRLTAFYIQLHKIQYILIFHLNIVFVLLLGIIKENVSCRNFKESVDNVKKKLNITDRAQLVERKIEDIS